MSILKKKPEPMQPDVRIENHGTLFLFRCETPRAEAWIEENTQIPDYAMLGAGAFGCEPRYARELAAGMLADGLEVR
jgi:hypothetical protein